MVHPKSSKYFRSERLHSGSSGSQALQGRLPLTSGAEPRSGSETCTAVDPGSRSVTVCDLVVPLKQTTPPPPKKKNMVKQKVRETHHKMNSVVNLGHASW